MEPLRDATVPMPAEHWHDNDINDEDDEIDDDGNGKVADGNFSDRFNLLAFFADTDANKNDKSERPDEKAAEKPVDLFAGPEGTVLLDGRKAVEGKTPTAEKLADDAPLTVKLDDGTYTRDKTGRVIATESADGKVKRQFEYGDAKNPNKVTSMVENGVVYKYLGPNTIAGKPVIKDGLEMSGWSTYDDQGRLTGNWYGARTIDTNGVYTEHDDGKNTRRKEGADKQELTAEEAKKRSEGGIWPNTIAVARPDGTGLHADLKGRTVETLKETYKDKASGEDRQRIWQRQGDKWVSDDKPALDRKDVDLDATGTLTYLQPDGKRFVVKKDGTYSITEKGVTNSFDRDGTRNEALDSEGKRRLKYTTDGGKPVLSEITTESGAFKSTWTRKPGTDEWSDGKKTEIRKDLKLLEDGTIEFSNAAGAKVREALSQKRSVFDKEDRPTHITYPSGAERRLDYDAKGLLSVKDTIPVKESSPPTSTSTPSATKTTELKWNRDGDGPEFVSEREGGQKFRRTAMRQVDGGNLEYTGTDGKTHTARVADVDRMARGEFVLSTESLMEARDRLTTAVAGSGLKSDRFNSWMKEFESNAAKYKLAPEKVVKAMNNLADMLESTAESPHYSKEQTAQIVDTAMHNLARPLEIDQGSHPTCNVTSVEVYAAVREPEHYTRLLKEVALTGKWQTFDGKTATPPAAALKPGKDETSYDLAKPDSGKRNIASQVFQMTLINAMYETGAMDRDKNKRSDHRYIMGPNKTQVETINGQRVTTDIGEDSLIDGSKKEVLASNGKPAHGPEMVQDDVIKSSVLLFGYEPPAIKCSGYADIPGKGREYFNHLPDKTELLKLKSDNKLPILTPTMGGMHAQTIHDVWEDPKSGEFWVLLDNQHGEPEVKGSERKSGEGDGDGWITLATLHDTLKMPAQGGQFGKPVMPNIHKYDHPSKKK